MIRVIGRMTGPTKIMPSRFSKGLRRHLPEEYIKFWKEWKSPQTPVHSLPNTTKYTNNPYNSQVERVTEPPIPVLFPEESHKGIWGGEGVVKGHIKPKLKKRRMSHYWIPQLKREILYSEILDKHMTIVVTERTMQLIDQHYGFDYYILQTPANDLQSLLALKIKRKLLQTLHDKSMYPNDLKKRDEVYEKYKQYIIPANEIEWYGLSEEEAMDKIEFVLEERNKPVPLKLLYRQQVLEELRQNKVNPEADEKETGALTSWMGKLNLFQKKPEAS